MASRRVSHKDQDAGRRVIEIVDRNMSNHVKSLEKKVA